MAAANVDIYNQRMNIRSGAPPPSPPASIARSSNGHGLYSMHNGAPHPNNPNRLRIEDQLADHYFELKKYLTESANSDTSYQPHNRARDKLLRLSPIQFQELSTDVYDELLRRKDEYEIPRDPNNPANNVPKFLLPKNNFHPKRNQARQKLSTLAIKKFRELATDVLHELGRRFPQFQEPDFSRGSSPAGSISRGPPGAPQYPREMRRPSTSSGSQPPYSPAIIPGSSGSGELNRPLPKTFQNNTMIPNKGTMVEDDDDHSAEDDAFDLEKDTQRSSRRTTNKSLPYSIHGDSAQVSQLERKVDELESQLHQRDEEVQRSKQDADKANNFLSDVERQLRSAQDLNSSLQGEIDKLRAQSSGSNEYKSRYEQLQVEYDKQQRTMEEVRRETKQHLHEMRQLSEQHDKAAENEENLAKKVSHLETELNEWRDRYAKACTQPRDARYKSDGLLNQQHNATRALEDGNLTDENGLVQDVAIKAYQIAVDDLLHKSRTSPPSEVLSHMRYVVDCVRGVTKDVDVNAPTDTDDGAKKRKKLKLRISGAANDLITTVTRFSKAEEHFPISVLDVAVIKLTDAIMEFVTFVKIRPSGAAELDDEMNGFI